jgi:hypothetical protein
MAEQGAEAGEEKYKGHKRPHELIPDYIKDREKIDVSGKLCTSLAGTHMSQVLLLAWFRTINAASNLADVIPCLSLISAQHTCPIAQSPPTGQSQLQWGAACSHAAATADHPGC